MVVSVLLLTGCVTTSERITAAAKEKSRIEAALILPELPISCKTSTISGVKRADRYDIAILKYDFALGESEKLRQACNQWYEKLKLEYSKLLGK